VNEDVLTDAGQGYAKVPVRGVVPIAVAGIGNPVSISEHRRGQGEECGNTGGKDAGLLHGAWG
jgi:hypothetical protein